ncbi:MAG: Gfo/Idh/MocA family oxidoreductase, partial [bacterium]|nr:Gfo/Idh/MocA family oxidoreductase [bacterium]
MKKVALVGFGFMGLTHTINILKNKRLQLVAIVDKNIENIEKNLRDQVGNFSTGNISNEALSGIRMYSTLDDCILQEQTDAYFICVHADLHFEMAEKALSAGNHVFLEKPFCLDIRQGEALIKLAGQKNLLLMVGHVVRFMPAYQQLNRWISSGEFGTLRFLSLSRYSGLPLWGQWKEKQRAFGSSGGALFDLIIHDIDFVQSVLGQPDSIRSIVLPGKLSNQDYVSAFWRYDHTGVDVKIEGGNTFHSAFPFQAGFAAQFENASVLYTSLKPETISISTDIETKQVPAGD